MHTGRDVVKAALLGAERYGFGTAALIAIGCKMARQCHSNTCPVGIATQAEELRKKYFGTPEMLISFFLSVAEEVREILAYLGYESVDEIVGRSDMLRQIGGQSDDRWAGLDLSRLTPPVAEGPLRNVGQPNGRPDDRLDDQILKEAADHLANGLRFTAEYEIRNSARAVGARLSGQIAKEHGDKGLPEGQVDLTFKGSAGQSFGAWLVSGVNLSLKGEANDFVGKGMTGGSISIQSSDRSGIAHDGPVLAGNTLLYGATGGRLFVAGRVGERFAVRNSGATAVVEGLGKHGCEYMSGGTIVVLGPTGRNFGAGMSGGRAYVMDEFGDFEARLNPMLAESSPVDAPGDLEELRVLIEEHLQRTGSARAKRILKAWPHAATRFWKVEPRSMEAPVRSTIGRRIRPEAAPATLTAIRTRRSATTNGFMTPSASESPT
jgi:glutamate synthase domain-containing protein 3